MSILTYKVPHNVDYSVQLKQAKQVANYAINNKDKLSTKYIKNFGLKSDISNCILRKYGKNKKIRKISKVKLAISSCKIKANQEKQEIYLPCLKTSFNYQFRNDFTKINQIEIDNNYYYISITIPDELPIKVDGDIGIDRNTNGHCVVAACNKTGKVMKLGKKAKHIHTKYSKIRQRLQRLGKFKKLRTIKRRESNIVRDLNHKISRKIVNYAKENNVGIKLENLQGIRNNRKNSKSFRYTLNSWSYFQLQIFTEYKSKLLGIPVLYIDPRYTSQLCSKCGLLGTRNGKSFKCPHCGYTSHADVNAAWNICYSEKLIRTSYQLGKEKDLPKGISGDPQGAMVC